MQRAQTVGNLYSIKPVVFEFEGVWRDVLGEQERKGAIWLIWGRDKNGKTWFTLLLAKMLTEFEKVYFISAEEGFKKGFIDTMRRAGMSATNGNIHFNRYITRSELYTILERRQAPRIIVIDNLTVYNDELKRGALKKLMDDFPDVLFILLAHEERGEPYTAVAKLAARLADVKFHVEGLRCAVSARCPGGILMIDEERANLYHGQALNGFKNATG